MHGPAPRMDAGHSSTKGSGDAKVLTVNLVPAGLRSSSTHKIQYLASRDTFTRFYSGFPENVE